MLRLLHYTTLTLMLVALPAALCADLPFDVENRWVGGSLAPLSLAPLSLAPDEGEDYGTLFLWRSDVEPEGGTPGLYEPLASDRPDFTEASCTVGAGVAQVEMGYTVFYDEEGGARLVAHSFPETLLRLGLFEDWLEFRLAWNYGHETESFGGVSNTFSGSQDLYLGFKLGLTPQQGILPEMALVPQMTVPLGSPLSAEEVLPGVNWLYGWDINEFVSTAGSTQFNRRVDDPTANAYAEFAQSWTIGYTLTERTGMYTEWFMLAPIAAEAAQTEHYFDAGLTHRTSHNLQWDIRAGTGLNSGAADFFGGVGAVVRF